MLDKLKREHGIKRARREWQVLDRSSAKVEVWIALPRYVNCVAGEIAANNSRTFLRDEMARLTGRTADLEYSRAPEVDMSGNKLDFLSGDSEKITQTFVVEII
jgi:hypothetical protein